MQGTRYPESRDIQWHASSQDNRDVDDLFGVDSRDPSRAASGFSQTACQRHVALSGHDLRRRLQLQTGIEVGGVIVSHNDLQLLDQRIP